MDRSSSGADQSRPLGQIRDTTLLQTCVLLLCHHEISQETRRLTQEFLPQTCKYEGLGKYILKIRKKCIQEILVVLEQSEIHTTHTLVLYEGLNPEAKQNYLVVPRCDLLSGIALFPMYPFKLVFHSMQFKKCYILLWNI